MVKLKIDVTASNLMSFGSKIDFGGVKICNIMCTLV